MYVCLCSGVSDTKINKAIDDGCRSLKQIKQATGAMSQCCKCCDTCKDLLKARVAIEMIHNDADDICHD